jgi:hypothetical protein
MAWLGFPCILRSLNLMVRDSGAIDNLWSSRHRLVYVLSADVKRQAEVADEIIITRTARHGGATE